MTAVRTGPALQVGVARELITPAVSMQMGGYNHRFGAPYQDVHDDLFARAVLLDSGVGAVLMITADLLFYDATLAAGVKEYARAAHGLRPDQVFVSYTHTHSGPAVRGLESTGLPDPRYEEFLLDRLCRLVDRVMLNRFAGALRHVEVAGNWNINRRRVVDGRVVLAPNEDGVRDPAVRLLVISDRRGRPRTILVNYGCHPVTVRDRPSLSAEFPGRVCALLEADFYGLTAMYFQGAGGNARPRVTARGDRFVAGDDRDVDDLARSIAAEIRNALLVPPAPARAPRIATDQFVVDLPMAVCPKDELAAVADDPATSPGTRHAVRQTLADYDTRGDTLPVPAGVIRLADNLHVAYLGGEPCYEIRQLVAPLFPDGDLMFVGYGDSSAYIGDDKILAEGGYEGGGFALRFGLKGPFAPGIDEHLRSAFADSLTRIAAKPAD